MSQLQSSLDVDLERLPSLSKEQIKEYLANRLPFLKECMKSSSANPGDAVTASCILFTHCLPVFDCISEAEKNFLSPVLPLFSNLSTEIFTNIENQLQTQELNVDDGLLQVPGILAQCINSCIHFYVSLVGLQPLDLKSFKDCMFQAIVNLLEHYCNSKRFLKTSSAEVLVDLSREVSAVLSSLIVLIKDKVNFDGTERNQEADHIFAKTIDFLFDVSRFAQQAELALPLLAKSWRVYYSLIAIVRKNAIPIDFEVIRPATYLCEQVLQYAELSLDETVPDNGAERLVKFAVFLFQILITMTGGNIESRLVSRLQDVFKLMLSLQRWSEPVLQAREAAVTNRQKMVSQEIVTRVKLLVENFLDKPDFPEWLFDLKFEDEPVQELMLVATVLEEVATKCSSETSQESCRILWINSSRDVNVLSTLFRFIDKCPLSLSNFDSGIYDSCLFSGCLFLVSLDAEEFIVAEQTLLQTLCGSWGTAWPWLLASDLWVCLAKSSNSTQLCLEHVSTLRLLCEQMPVGPQRRMVTSLCQRLIDVMAQFPGVVESGEPLMDFKVDQIKAQIEEFLERPSEASFRQCLDAVDLMRRKSARVELLEVLLRLLPFCHDLDALSECMGLKVLSTCVHYTPLLDARALDTLLTNVPFFCSPALRVASLELLWRLSSRRLDASSVVRLVSEAFNDLLQHHSVVVRKAALQTFVTFAQCSPHEDVVPMAVANNKALQLTVSAFIQKRVSDNYGVDEEMRRLSKIAWAPCDEMRVEKIAALRSKPHGLDTPPRLRTPSPENTLSQMSVGSAVFSSGSPEENSACDTQVAELTSFIDSSVKELKHEKLSAKNKKEIKKSLVKLQGLLDDTF
ncbi:Hypothetical predicted protein [Cloeon dipterum]|uniref:Uncharacterized protein n=1 Tax=Cloeon dipterum TaxID=197152 RepID=A0A8S1D312_9INSE|nr:Hypothetical predicted protein [Cloeon dipterum]